MSDGPANDRIQLHLVLPYKIELRRDRQVREYLARGYRVVGVQRITDHEVFVTLARGTAG